MAKSNYGQIKKYENEILAMKEAGYTKRRIAEELALTKEQIKEFLKRHRRRERKIEVGIPGRSQGRSSKGNTVNDVELAPKYENRGRPQNLIFHSDRGAQYTSAGYVNLLNPSLSRNSPQWYTTAILIFPKSSDILSVRQEVRHADLEKGAQHGKGTNIFLH